MTMTVTVLFEKRPQAAMTWFKCHFEINRSNFEQNLDGRKLQNAASLMSRVPRKFLLSFWVKAGHNQPVHGTGWRGEEQEFILKNAVVRIWLKGNTFIAHRAHATHAQFFQGVLIAWLSFPVGRHLFMFSCTSGHWRLLISVAPRFEPPKSAPLLHFLILCSSTRKRMSDKTVCLSYHPPFQECGDLMTRRMRLCLFRIMHIVWQMHALLSHNDY